MVPGRFAGTRAWQTPLFGRTRATAAQRDPDRSWTMHVPSGLAVLLRIATRMGTAPPPLTNAGAVTLVRVGWMSRGVNEPEFALVTSRYRPERLIGQSTSNGNELAFVPQSGLPRVRAFGPYTRDAARSLTRSEAEAVLCA